PRGKSFLIGVTRVLISTQTVLNFVYSFGLRLTGPFSGRRVALSRVFIVASALALRFRYLLQRNGSAFTPIDWYLH
ncbi:unnamed protein product, partial [Brassica rapa]